MKAFFISLKAYFNFSIHLKKFRPLAINAKNLNNIVCYSQQINNDKIINIDTYLVFI